MNYSWILTRYWVSKEIAGVVFVCFYYLDKAVDSRQANKGECGTVPCAAAEHSRPFGFQPSKSVNSKRKARSSIQSKSKPLKPVTWRKDCVVLRDCQQSWKPSSEEKIELAKMGFGVNWANFQTLLEMLVRFIVCWCQSSPAWIIVVAIPCFDWEKIPTA